MTTIESSHCLTSEVAPVTWSICRSADCAQTQGGVGIKGHRRRPVIDVLDPFDVPVATTLGEFNVANGAAPTCICGCERLGNGMYGGYSKWCHDLKDYQASRNEC